MNFNQIKFSKPFIYIDGIGGVVVYDPDAQAYFDRVTAAGGTLTTAEKNAANTLVLAYKAAGAWTNTLQILPYLGGSAVSMVQNLRSASYTASFSGGWTYDSLGATPNGTNAYLNTGINVWPDLPDTNSFSMGGYINTNAKTNAYQMGAIGGNGTYNLIGHHVINATQGYFLNNTTTATVITDAADFKGFYATSRTASTNYNYYKNIVSTNITANSSSVAYLYPILMGCGNGFSGVPTAYDTARIAFGHLGAGFSDSIMLQLANAVIAFQTSLGRA